MPRYVQRRIIPDGVCSMQDMANILNQEIKYARHYQKLDRRLYTGDRQRNARNLVGSARQYRLRVKLFRAARQGDQVAIDKIYQLWGCKFTRGGE